MKRASQSWSQRTGSAGVTATGAGLGLALLAWALLVSEPRTQTAVSHEASVIKPERVVAVSCKTSSVSERRAEGRPLEASIATVATCESEPATVERAPGDLAALELRVLSPDSGWFATISGQQPMFMVNGRPSWSGQIESGSRVATDWYAEGDGRATFADAPGDTYVFKNLRPGVPFSVAAADRWKLPVTCIDVEPLTPGELRVVDLQVDGYLRRLSGEILSPEGEPILGARIFISHRGELSRRGSQSNNEGQFEFNGLGCDELVLWVSAPGYANLVDTRFPVNDAPVRLIMERGREVQVQVHSAGGAAVSDAYLVARHPGAGSAFSAYGSTDDEGLCVFERVAAVDLPLEVTVSGRTFPAALGAGETRLDVEVPERQACRVHFVGQLPPSESTQLRARLTRRDLPRSLSRGPGAAPGSRAAVDRPALRVRSRGGPTDRDLPGAVGTPGSSRGERDARRQIAILLR
jgi:hypothetical protein